MSARPIQHGLRPNAFQFWTLVLVNAFVGGMVGLERSILPEIAESEMGLDSTTAILSFIIAFGVTKAITNYFAGRWANVVGRKWLLVIGWLFALPVPVLLIHAPNWDWVIFANILLGINQGLAWSSTVVMKIDLVGDKERGLAMGLNEFSGYLAVGVTAFFTAYIAEQYGLRPYPFYLGIVLAGLGLLLSVFVVKDTRQFVQLEQQKSKTAELGNVFWSTTLSNRNLSATTQAGLINNLNDGMIWGLLPLLLMSQEFDKAAIGWITAIYPAVWGIGQLFTGRLADLVSNKKILFWGMFLQGLAILGFATAHTLSFYLALGVLLGLGTALVYPTFFVVIAKNTSPVQRAESIGVFRLWRDLGYAIGALLSGLIADWFGLEAAIITIGVLTIFSAGVIQVRMRESEATD
jgi:MFS family permease